MKVGIYVNDSLHVDGAAQMLTADFFLIQRWHDLSLASVESFVKSRPSFTIKMFGVQNSDGEKIRGPPPAAECG